VCLSALCLRQMDPLSRPKDDALPGLHIGRYGPQKQRCVERIDPERGPEGKLADPMLFRMAGGAQWNGIAIARLPIPPSVAARTCAASDGAALPQAMQGS